MAAASTAGHRPAARTDLHATTVLLSLGLHVLGFGAALGLPRLLPRHAPGAPVYVVDLVSLPPGGDLGKPVQGTRRVAAPKAPPVKKAAPAPKKTPPPAPVRPQPIKIPDRDTPATKKQPPAKPPAEKKPDPAPEPASAEETTASPAGATTAPPEEGAPQAAATGGIGVNLGGDGAGGPGANDEYTFYLSLLDRNIRRSWDQPLYMGTGTLSATVSLTLSSSGRVIQLVLVTPSGYDPLDRSVIRAVREAEPFPPFPHFLGRDSLTVQVVFDLNPQGEGTAPSGDQ